MNTEKLVTHVKQRMKDYIVTNLRDQLVIIKGEPYILVNPDQLLQLTIKLIEVAQETM